MNQMERLFKGCEFAFAYPHPNEYLLKIQYNDIASHGLIVLYQVIDIQKIDKRRAKTLIRKLNDFANMILNYAEGNSKFGSFDRLAFREWLENTDWYMVERG